MIVPDLVPSGKKHDPKVSPNDKNDKCFPPPTFPHSGILDNHNESQYSDQTEF